MPRASSDETVFHAVACPTRRAILDALSLGETNVSALVDAVSVTQSAVSQQLAVLKNAGLVGERSEGRYRYYSLRAEPLAEIDVWMERYRAVIERRLDALGHVLFAMPDLPEDAASPARRSRATLSKRRGPRRPKGARR
jgi:DNA-binding transcriptional ArsR family regulator